MLKQYRILKSIKLIKNIIKSPLRSYFSGLVTNDVNTQNRLMEASSILFYEYGFIKTLKTQNCIDKHGEPIPWYTYPAIDYIKQLDFSMKRIFEYGLGNSSRFWAKRALTVVSVEEKKDWYNKCLEFKQSNQEILLREKKEEYFNSIFEYDNFDTIIVDGDFCRYNCAQNAVQKLNKGGLIILDNSDRAAEFDEYNKAATFLRDKGFIQVDMSGFGPINGFTWCTSFFFSRDFDFKPAHNVQPAKSLGNISEL